MNPLESIARVTRRLRRLEVPHAFLGGAIVSLLVDDPDGVAVQVMAMLITAGHFAQFFSEEVSATHLPRATQLVLELAEETMQLAFREIDNDMTKPWITTLSL